MQLENVLNYLSIDKDREANAIGLNQSSAKDIVLDIVICISVTVHKCKEQEWRLIYFDGSI